MTENGTVIAEKINSQSIIGSVAAETMEHNPYLTTDQVTEIILDLIDQETLRKLDDFEIKEESRLEIRKRELLRNRMRSKFRNEINHTEREKQEFIKSVKDVKHATEIAKEQWSDSDLTHFLLIDDHTNPFELPYSDKSYEHHYGYLNRDIKSLTLFDSQIDLISDHKNPMENEIKFMDLFEKINHLIAIDESFSRLDSGELTVKLFRILGSSGLSLPEHQLQDRIKKMLLIEAVSGLFDDLTDEEKTNFKESSKRGQFF